MFNFYNTASIITTSIGTKIDIYTIDVAFIIHTLHIQNVNSETGKLVGIFKILNR